MRSVCVVTLYIEGVVAESVKFAIKGLREGGREDCSKTTAAKIWRLHRFY